MDSKRAKENLTGNNATLKTGENCCVGKRVSIGKNVVLGHNCVIEDDTVIGNNVFIDSNTIIRRGVSIKEDSFIGSNCIIGEYLSDTCMSGKYYEHALKIEERALIRSGSIIYAGSDIGSDFQTGHQVTIREKSHIGTHVSIGTLSDIQGNCEIGNYVRLHSNVHVGQLSQLDDFVWVFPYVIFTNDPTPPSDKLIGVHVKSFAVIAAGAILLPGIEIGEDTLVAAGAVVTKSVPQYMAVAGNPARQISDVRNIKNRITGERVYPWRDHFYHHMPWTESDFHSWYASLDVEESQRYKFCSSDI